MTNVLDLSLLKDKGENMRISIGSTLEEAAEFVQDCNKFKSPIELTVDDRLIIDAKSAMGVYECLTASKYDIDINAISTDEQNKFVDLMRSKYAPR